MGETEMHRGDHTIPRRDRHGSGKPTATYHDRPSIKPSPWTGKVPTYVAIAGMGGGAQVIAWLARLAGGERNASIVRHGRLAGLAAAIAGAPLLIADLKTPQRFHHMLRIFRPTSPMSIGSFVLTSFGAFSAATVAGTLAGGRRGRAGRLMQRAGDAAQLPAAIAGAGMATYTGALLAATSVPVWAATPALVGARFGASALASGAAVLSLAEHARGDRDGHAPALDGVALAASVAGLALSWAASSRLAAQGVGAPLVVGTRAGFIEKAGSTGLGQLLPIGLLAVNALSRRPSKARSVLAAGAILAGAFALRHAIMAAEKPSAERARDYLGWTRHGAPPVAALPNGGER